MKVASKKSGRARSLLVAAAALAATTLAGQASAAPVAAQAPAVHVRYNDLDLATEQGSRALYRRIQVAARQVCPVSDIRDLAAMSQALKCQAAAVNRAVDDVHSPQLAALHANLTRTRHG